jgi:hypothetical protein
MRRRDFVAFAVGGVASAWPLTALSQRSARMRQVGFLYPGPQAGAPSRVAAFMSGLQSGGLPECKKSCPLYPIADICIAPAHVRFGPKADTAFNEELIVAENYAGGEIHAWRAVLRPRPFGGTGPSTPPVRFPAGLARWRPVWAIGTELKIARWQRNPRDGGRVENSIVADRRNHRARGRLHLCSDIYETQRGASTQTHSARYKRAWGRFADAKKNL